MNKNRLEAFSDGVLAILITIMVLELKIPIGDNFSDLFLLLPKISSYVLSFIYIGIYWNNHHHLIHTIKKVNGKIMWANMHLLFWLSLIPFVTAWAGENNFTKAPVATYGLVLLMSGFAYSILTLVIISTHGKDSILAQAIGSDLKGKLSVVIYAIAIGLTCWFRIVSCLLYIMVAIMWLIPDKRIENALEMNNK